MNRVESAMKYRRLRAPKDHAQWLIDPPWENVPSELAANLNLAQQREYDFQGQSIKSLSAAARSHLRNRAIAYTRRYRHVDTALAGSEAPLAMTGHQPELYHPGVWFKNFVLDRIARQQQAIGINLLIDNDIMRQPAIRVPTGSVGDPHVEWIAFDRMQDELPFEERRLVDPNLFGSFAERVRARRMDRIESPLVEQLWPEALEASRSNENLGSCLSQARHQLEAAWGLKTLEVPLSEICETVPFRWFAAAILARLPRFQRIHNESLEQYRRFNRIRSRTHPVPPLATEGQWLEAPFWLWSSTDPRRRRLFARRAGHGIEITDRHTQLHDLPLTAEGSCDAAVERLCDLSERGFKLRSRALLTTMYTRLFLCDLFIHGIGGAKYDQLTDELIQRCFGFESPGFLTATATAKLPFGHRSVPESAIALNQCKLRELRFNPQRFLDLDAKAAPLVEAKQRLISAEPRFDGRRERHLQISQLNDAMQPMVALQREKLLRQRAELLEQAHIDKLLGSREYSFCLFSEATLRPLLLDI